MAEIINHNPEDNPRLSEIYEILLLAGYFRIRIGSLKAFDKVTGGIAWCITSSNFSIEIQYNDEMQIGQKIKVSEVVCHSLQQMKCPYPLQPFQLQGLDVNNIYPIVQWLVKFVYQTREQRQKYDRSLSLFLGKNITKIEPKGSLQNVHQLPIERHRINKAIFKTNYNHPVRIYSALLQYKDASSYKMYHKLLNIITRAEKQNKSQAEKKSNKVSQQKQEIIGILQEKQTEDFEEKSKSIGEMKQFGEVNNFSYDRLEKIIHHNKENIQEGIKEAQHHQIQSNIKQEKSENSEKVGDASLKTQKIDKQKQKITVQAKRENDKLKQQISTIQAQLISFENLVQNLEDQKKTVQEKHVKAKQRAIEEIQKNKQYKNMVKQIKQSLNQKKQVNSKLQKLVEKRQNLKNKKTELKKKAKAKIQELKEERKNVQAAFPEIDEEAFQEMMKEADLKKEIFDKKYEELTLVNQQLAIMQRKAENQTSSAQVVQYHKRFIELFESINILIEEKRSMYSEMTNLQSTKKVIKNYYQILKNTKEGYSNISKKQDLKELVENMKQIYQGLESNMKNSEITYQKIKSKCESTYGEFMDFIKLQRDYLHLLRELKIQYQKATKDNQ